jgi:hypothetical protein
MPTEGDREREEEDESGNSEDGTCLRSEAGEDNESREVCRRLIEGRGVGGE